MGSKYFSMRDCFQGKVHNFKPVENQVKIGRRRGDFLGVAWTPSSYYDMDVVEELGIWTKWRIWMGAVMKDIDGVGRYGIACEMWGQVQRLGLRLEIWVLYLLPTMPFQLNLFKIQEWQQQQQLSLERNVRSITHLKRIHLYESDKPHDCSEN